MNHITIKILVMFFIGFTFLGKLHAHGNHSVPCSGPHKDDPECVAPPPPPPPATISVYSASVDWLNEKIIVGGENFTGTTTITIAGQTALIGSWAANQIEIPFDGDIAGTVKGNHNLIASEGTDTSSLSLFIKAEIIDIDTAGCPCTGAWSTELGAVGLWPPDPLAIETDCFELPGGVASPEDIAGTVLTNHLDPAVYPHYPIGAAFTPEPNESVCQLTKVTSPLDPTAVTDLVKIRINRQQQADCRAVLAANVCKSITTVGP